MATRRSASEQNNYQPRKAHININKLPLTFDGLIKKWCVDAVSKGCELSKVIDVFGVVGVLYTRFASGWRGTQIQLGSWVSPEWTTRKYETTRQMQCLYNIGLHKGHWHVDETPGVLLCLRGAKLVRYVAQCNNDAVGSLHAMKRGLDNFRAKDVMEIELEPGSYLYIPPMVLHQVDSKPNTFAVSYTVVAPQT